MNRAGTCSPPNATPLDHQQRPEYATEPIPLQTLRMMRTTIQRRFGELGKQIEAKKEEREKVRSTAVAARPFDIGLIDEIPNIPLRLRNAPEELQRALYDAYNLDVRYHKPTGQVTITNMTLTVIRHATLGTDP